ncbi:MAG TPA: M14 metallopeptidase family protein [Gemmatimonadaceae bacterium]
MRRLQIATIAVCLLAPGFSASAQSRITSPLQEFGHNIGDDYFLANYQQLLKYWEKLDRQSDRLRVVRIGTSAEGRPMVMAIITAPENFRKLERYREISARLARAEGVTEDEARALSREGKAIVWIDGGLHATEVLGAQQLIQYVYEMVSRTDDETMRFLRDDILLATLVNPDGMDLVSDWYMREPVKENRSTSGVPRLYQKYIGHDNNRDSFLASQPETQAVDSIFYRAWHPQIVYNHHQTGPSGTVLFAPPFRDPFNYNFDPLIPAGIDLVGAAMHSRFIREGKPGATMRTGASYSTWWNGGLRTTVYFHNMIGLLTETIGNPTPMEIPLVPERLLPSGTLPFPILPQKWRFSQSLAYELSANRAVMDVASKYREDFLFNSWRMGRNSIDRGNKDSWTLKPLRVDAVKAAVAKDREAGARADASKYIGVLHDPAARDPRGYIIPADQADFATATRFVNALVKTGVTIHRATAQFSVAGKTYPAGSYVVKTAQAFRPHVLDMFEPQNHPDDIPYPGGPPTPPYDNAGWTLAYQMGVKFDRVLDAFTGPFAKLEGFAPVPSGSVASTASWYSWSRSTNDAFAAVNRLLKSGQEVYTLERDASVGGRAVPAGTFIVRTAAATPAILSAIARERGVRFDAISAAPVAGLMQRLALPRIALWDVYGGDMSSGWMRFVFDQFEFPYDVVFAGDIDSADLSTRYDVLILPDGARLPAPEPDTANTFQPRAQPDADKIPAEWRPRLGRISRERSLPRIRSFVEKGGTLLALGEASEIGYALSLPVRDAVVGEDDKRLPRSKYFVPGSVLSVAVDSTSPIGWGMRSRADIFFDNNPAFRFASDARAKGVKRVAWFDSPAPLRSGWAWGQKILDGAAEVVTAPIGKGNVVLYGPQVHFRGQTHGAFKFLFNGIYYGQLDRP